jgi:hypothetical protein
MSARSPQRSASEVSGKAHFGYEDNLAYFQTFRHLTVWQRKCVGYLSLLVRSEENVSTDSNDVRDGGFALVVAETILPLLGVDFIVRIADNFEKLTVLDYANVVLELEIASVDDISNILSNCPLLRWPTRPRCEGKVIVELYLKRSLWWELLREIKHCPYERGDEENQGRPYPKPYGGHRADCKAREVAESLLKSSDAAAIPG